MPIRASGRPGLGKVEPAVEEGGRVDWTQWLSERSFGEVICLILVVGTVVAATLRALTGRGA